MHPPTIGDTSEEAATGPEGALLHLADAVLLLTAETEDAIDPVRRDVEAVMTEADDDHQVLPLDKLVLRPLETVTTLPAMETLTQRRTRRTPILADTEMSRVHRPLTERVERALSARSSRHIFLLVERTTLASLASQRSEQSAIQNSAMQCYILSSRRTHLPLCPRPSWQICIVASLTSPADFILRSRQR